MPFPNDTLKKALAELELLPADRLEAAFHDAEARGEPLSDYLVERHLITDENMGRLLADIPGLSYVNLRNETIPEEVLKIAPVEMARHSRLFPFRQDGAVVHVAVNDMDDLAPIAALRKKLRGKKVQLHYATRADIEMAVARYRKDIKPVFQELVAKIERALEDKPELTSVEAPQALPVAELVDALLLYAYQASASELHIEPAEKEALVRFRVDGIMHDIVRYPIHLHELIVARLKTMARLRVEEHFAAQEGKLREIFDGETVDVRVGTVPIIAGEKVVLRLQTERGRHLTLESVGLSQPDIETIRQAMRKKAGLIMAAGPTGSGKSATLYGVIKELARPELDITTIEDPIEYDLPGVSQIQVDPKTGVTFAAGLRAIGEDPDVIMVSEIRDEETAGLVMSLAATEHLVLSSLVAGDAAKAVARLREMGIEAAQAAASVVLVVAQRLVRKICPRCVRTVALDLSEARSRGVPDDVLGKLFGAKKGITAYAGAKCAFCRYTGYQGRIGIYELLDVGEPIRAVILRRAGADELRAEAVRLGMKTMLEDGVRKVLDGLTTVDELVRTLRD